MSLPWFRFYHEFAGDPVIQGLAFEDQRHYVMVLCLKASGVLDRGFPTPEILHRVVCSALGLDTVSGTEARRRLADFGLVDESWQPTAWDKRQFKSDGSTERVRKWRSEKSSPNPPPEEQETEEETDTEGKRCMKQVCNVSETLHLHDTLPTDAWAEWIEHRKARRWTCSDLALKRQLALLAKHDTATQREILDTSIQAGWQGLFEPKGSRKPRPTRYEELMRQAEAPRQVEPSELSQFLIGGKQ